MLGFLLLIVIAGTLTPAFAADKVERVAKLSEIKGDVKVKKAGGAKPFKAFDNMAVTKGDQIITGADSSVKLLLDDGSKITVGSNTQSLISDLMNSNGGNQTAVKVVSGQVWSKIENLSNANDSFQFETPTAVMGIRGTMVFIRGNSVSVAEGLVSVQGVVPGSQTALALANEQAEVSESGALQGSTIDVRNLVDSMDLVLLKTAAEDIIAAVYDAKNNPQFTKAGKGIANEFLTQAAEFVRAAKAKDPSISVPSDFEQVVEQVKKLIEENRNNPNNPNPHDTVSTHYPGKGSLQNPGSSLPPTPPAGGSSGGSGGSGGGGGGGSSQNDSPSITSMIASPVGNGERSHVVVAGKNTRFLQKTVSVSVLDSQWGGIPVGIDSAGAASDTEFSFDVNTPDDGSYTITIVYDGKLFSKSVAFHGAPSRIESVTTKSGSDNTHYVDLQGRNLVLQSGEVSLSIKGGKDNKTYTIRNIKILGKSQLSFDLPDEIEEGTYSLTLRVGDKTYTYPAFVIPKKQTRITAAVNSTDASGRRVLVTGTHTHFKQNETILTVTDALGKEVYRAANGDLSVGKDTELQFQLPLTVTGKVTLTVKTGSEEVSGPLELPTVKELSIAYPNDPLVVNKPVQLQAAVKYSDGATLSVTDKASWSLADASLATISSSGLLTPIKAGTIEVRAAFAGKRASATLQAISTVKQLTITPSTLEVVVGNTANFAVAATLNDGTVEDVTTKAIWTVSDADIAAVNGGVVTGLKAGNTSITAAYEGQSVQASVAVSDPYIPPPGPTVTAVRFGEEGPITVGLGSTTATYLHLVASMSDGTNRTLTSGIVWNTSDANVVTIQGDGKIIAHAAGSASVTATYGGKSTDQISIIVVPLPDQPDRPDPPTNATFTYAYPSDPEQYRPGTIAGTIRWSPTAAQGVTGYEIYFKTAGGTEFIAAVDGADVSSHVIDTANPLLLPADTTGIAVFAKNENGLSATAAEVTKTATLSENAIYASVDGDLYVDISGVNPEYVRAYRSATPTQNDVLSSVVADGRLIISGMPRSGAVYFTVTEPGKLESDRVMKTYGNLTGPFYKIKGKVLFSSPLSEDVTVKITALPADDGEGWFYSQATIIAGTSEASYEIDVPGGDYIVRYMIDPNQELPKYISVGYYSTTGTTDYEGAEAVQVIGGDVENIDLNVLEFAPALQTLTISKGTANQTTKITAINHPEAVSFKYYVWPRQMELFPERYPLGAELDSEWQDVELNQDIHADEGDGLSVAALDENGKVIAYSLKHLDLGDVKITLRINTWNKEVVLNEVVSVSELVNLIATFDQGAEVGVLNTVSESELLDHEIAIVAHKDSFPKKTRILKVEQGSLGNSSGDPLDVSDTTVTYETSQHLSDAKRFLESKGLYDISFVNQSMSSLSIDTAVVIETGERLYLYKVVSEGADENNKEIDVDTPSEDLNALGNLILTAKKVDSNEVVNNSMLLLVRTSANSPVEFYTIKFNTGP